MSTTPLGPRRELSERERRERLISYDLPLRPDLIVRLNLPHDLTMADAERVARFARALAFGHDDGETVNVDWITGYDGGPAPPHEPEGCAEIHPLLHLVTTALAGVGDDGVLTICAADGRWFAAITWGREAEDSPMAGAQAVGEAETPVAALRAALDQTGWLKEKIDG